MGVFGMIVGLGFIGVASYLLATLKKEDPNYKTMLGFGIFFILIGTIIFMWNLLKYMIQYVPVDGNVSVTQNPVFVPANNRYAQVQHPNKSINLARRNNVPQ